MIRNSIELLGLERLTDMLKMQQELDGTIEPLAPRTEEHMFMSAIAECIEFNEEMDTKRRHKTWKAHIYDPDKLRKEFIDIFFFMLQVMNNRGIYRNERFKVSYVKILAMPIPDSIKEMHHDARGWAITHKTMELISVLSQQQLASTIFCYKGLMDLMGIDLNRLYELYEDKWKFNLGRTVSGEWNGKEKKHD